MNLNYEGTKETTNQSVARRATYFLVFFGSYEKRVKKKI